MDRAKILIVEDEAIVALDLKLQLQELGYEVVAAVASAEQALEAAASLRPQLVLMDVRLQGEMDGIAAAQLIRQRHQIPLIFLTSHSDNDTVRRAAQAAPYGYLTKPYQQKELRAGIEVALTKASMERQLRASESRFRSAFDFAPLGMALVSFAGEFLQVNDAFCSLLGRSRESLAADNCGAITVEADRAQEAKRLCELALAEAGVVQFEKRFHRADGAAVWTLVSASLLRDADQVACYLYQVHDLTAQKSAAEQLALLADERMRRQASELASAAKSEFLSRASHEMRTPLNAVMGFAQLLQLQSAHPKTETVARYADHIYAAGKHLLALVTDLLELNQAGQGELKVDTGPTGLAQVVGEALGLIRGQAAAHGVDIAADISPELMVMADAQRLRQVLVNLGSNAIKYNRQGGQVRMHASPTAAGAIQITIQDDGIGMTAEQLERLFQPFDRLGAELTAVPGTGLGLVIARSLVVAMGGSLTVDSVSRAGTGVTVVLQAA